MFSMVDVNAVGSVLMTDPLLIGQRMVGGVLDVSASLPARHPFGRFISPLDPTSLHGTDDTHNRLALYNSLEECRFVCMMIQVQYL